MSEPREIKARTFEFASRIVKLCRDLEELNAPQTLIAQVLRSGTSVGASVEEAHGNQSKPEFIAKMALANKEVRETNYWLRLLTASDLVPKGKLDDITDESHQLIAILTTIVKRSRENQA